MSRADVDMKAEIRVNGQPRPWRNQKVDELLRELDLDPERRGIAVAINDRVVRRADWAGLAIRPGDRVEIVRPLAGG